MISKNFPSVLFYANLKQVNLGKPLMTECEEGQDGVGTKDYKEVDGEIKFGNLDAYKEVEEVKKLSYAPTMTTDGDRWPNQIAMYIELKFKEDAESFYVFTGHLKSGDKNEDILIKYKQ